MGINIVAGYLASKAKKKCHSWCKTLPSDEEEENNSFSEDSWGDDDPGPPWNLQGTRWMSTTLVHHRYRADLGSDWSSREAQPSH